MAVTFMRTYYSRVGQVLRPLRLDSNCLYIRRQQRETNYYGTQDKCDQQDWELYAASLRCALCFTSVQHCLEMLVHYLVTLSYKPVQTTSLHIRRSMFLRRHEVRFQSQSPNPHHTTRHIILCLGDELSPDWTHGRTHTQSQDTD